MIQVWRGTSKPCHTLTGYLVSFTSSWARTMS